VAAPYSWKRLLSLGLILEMSSWLYVIIQRRLAVNKPGLMPYNAQSRARGCPLAVSTWARQSLLEPAVSTWAWQSPLEPFWFVFTKVVLLSGLFLAQVVFQKIFKVQVSFKWT
jgi:hypothetical protein